PAAEVVPSPPMDVAPGDDAASRTKTMPRVTQNAPPRELPHPQDKTGPKFPKRAGESPLRFAMPESSGASEATTNEVKAPGSNQAHRLGTHAPKAREPPPRGRPAPRVPDAQSPVPAKSAREPPVGRQGDRLKGDSVLSRQSVRVANSAVVFRLPPVDDEGGV